jgi:hypothetical protein
MAAKRDGDVREGVRRLRMWSAIAAILLLPLLATQFTDEVAWTSWDFAVATALLGGAGAVYELAAWRTRDPIRRRLVGALIIAVVAVIWADGAVGIF